LEEVELTTVGCTLLPELELVIGGSEVEIGGGSEFEVVENTRGSLRSVNVVES
jgi:hypothetical protein